MIENTIHTVVSLVSTENKIWIFLQREKKKLTH